MIKILNESGEEFFPATITDAVGHNQCECSMTDLINDYNVTTIWPKEDAYTLTTAIEILNEKLLEDQKKPGVKARFTNSQGIYEEWEYFAGGYSFSNELGWRQTDSSIILELANEVFPVTSTLNVSQTLFQTKKNYNVTFSWKVMRKGVDVTGNSRKYFNSDPVTTLNTTITVNETTKTTKTYTFTGSYQGLSSSSSKTLTFVDLTYKGIVANNWSPNESDIKAFTSNLQSSKSYTWSGINLNYQKMVYAYPQYFGTLTSIKDANNFDYINSYTRSSITIDGVDYYVYVLTNPTTITGAKQIYS